MAPKALIRTIKRSDIICKKLHKHNFKTQKSLLKKLPARDFSAISDCFVGLVNQNKHFRVPQFDSDKLKNILAPHKRSIKKYVAQSKKQRHKSVQKGGFFSLILTAILPVLGELVAHLVKKYILKE